MSTQKNSYVAIFLLAENFMTGISKAMILATLLLASATSFAWWQSGQTVASPYECTQVALEDVDKSLLTKEERIALLDESLTASIDSYSTCVSSAAQAMSGGGSGQGEGTSGQDAQENNDNTNSVNNASSANQMPEEIRAQQTQQRSDDTRGAPTSKTPRGIIPPKDNDKIICKLLFQEIATTQDADMLKGLKQQYQNYQCG